MFKTNLYLIKHLCADTPNSVVPYTLAETIYAARNSLSNGGVFKTITNIYEDVLRALSFLIELSHYSTSKNLSVHSQTIETLIKGLTYA